MASRLRTVLFTDIVASTQHAATTGDKQWRAVCNAFVKVKSTGDGSATFEGHAGHPVRRSPACHAEAMGIEMPAGLHTRPAANCSTPTSGGGSRYTSRRILGHAGAGEILVSRTVRDLVVGSGTGFLRTAELSNCVACPAPGSSWAVDRHGARAGSPEAEPASMPTPWTPDRDAPLGPRRGSGGEAYPARDRTARTGRRSQPDRCQSRGAGCSLSSTGDVVGVVDDVAGQVIDRDRRDGEFASVAA